MPPKAKLYTFHADPTKRPTDAHPDSPQIPEPYIADDKLKRAVNLAIFLRRPLLIEGEAGCGKSRLAHAVAYELGLPLKVWPIRSTSKAQEGLYSYDAILRLHDVHTAQLHYAENHTPVKPPRDPARSTDYRRLGPLGEAFNRSECSTVVLIDEIDKADVDFPNDLLTVLDDPWEFPIPETGEPPIQAEHKPIVILTSNKEKGNLPAPFLRRCIYYYIEFPDNVELLNQIVDAHYALHKEKPPAKSLVSAAADRFVALREKKIFQKQPGTSEFLDWLRALYYFGPDAPYKVEDVKNKSKPLPYPELLIKLRMDWLRYLAEVGVPR